MTCWRAWQAYWFRPSPLFDLAIVRLIAVGFQLHHLATMDPKAVFGPLTDLPDFMYAPVVALRVMLLPLGLRYRPLEDEVIAVHWLTLAVGVFAFIGFRTTISLMLFAAGNLFLQAFEYSFQEIHHPEAIVILTIALLALSPAGGTLSLDDLLRRLRAAGRGDRRVVDPLEGHSRFARWPLLVIQWMFALIYLSAGYHKLQASGVDWMNGWTLQFYMVQDAMRWGNSVAGTGAGRAAQPGIGMWIGQSHAFALVGSWVSILFETLFWLVLLFPRLALIFLPIGAAFHIGIYVIQRAPFLSFVWLYAVFVPWSVVFRQLAHGCRGISRGRRGTTIPHQRRAFVARH